jgi:hypothetical protein
MGPGGASLVAHAQLDHRAAEMGLERGRRVVGDHPAAVDHRDALGQAVGLLQVLGGEQYGGALGHELADHLPQLAPALQIQAGGGLVQEQHRRARHQRGGHVQAAPHAAGVGPHRPVGRLGEAEPLQQLARSDPDLPAGHLGEPADQPQVLLTRQVGIDRRVLASQAEAVADRDRVAGHVDAQHLGTPAVGEQDGREDADGPWSCRPRWGRATRTPCPPGPRSQSPSSAVTELGQMLDEDSLAAAQRASLIAHR